jgi:hypothetical protein
MNQYEPTTYLGYPDGDSSIALEVILSHNTEDLAIGSIKRLI